MRLKRCQDRNSASEINVFFSISLFTRTCFAYVRKPRTSCTTRCREQLSCTTCCREQLDNSCSEHLQCFITFKPQHFLSIWLILLCRVFRIRIWNLANLPFPLCLKNNPVYTGLFQTARNVVCPNNKKEARP